MAEKPNQKASSQSSKLDENELQRLKEDSRWQSECKCAFVELNSLNQFMYLCGPNCLLVFYASLYNNQINARTLIGQSAVGYCAGKPTKKIARLLNYYIKAINHKFSMGYRLINH